MFFNEFEINVFLLKIKMEILFTIENQRVPTSSRTTISNFKKPHFAINFKRDFTRNIYSC